MTFYITVFHFAAIRYRGSLWKYHDFSRLSVQISQTWSQPIRDVPAKHVEFRLFSQQSPCRITGSPRDHWHERKLTNWLTRDNITGRPGRLPLRFPTPATSNFTAHHVSLSSLWPYLCKPSFFTSLPESLRSFHYLTKLRLSKKVPIWQTFPILSLFRVFFIFFQWDCLLLK